MVSVTYHSNRFVKLAKSGIRSAHDAAEEHSQRALRRRAVGCRMRRGNDTLKGACQVARRERHVVNIWRRTVGVVPEVRDRCAVAEHASRIVGGELGAVDDPAGQSQVQAVMNGTIDNVSHDFINNKLPGRSVTCIRIPSAQYRGTT